MSSDNTVGPSSPTRRPQGDSDFVSPTGHLSDRESSPIAVIPDSLTQKFLSPESDDWTGLGHDKPRSAEHRSTFLPALEFRVVRPGAPVRRLRLTGNRYTFGSGEGCSIRLEDDALRPMHAVLLRDAHRVLMRAYSVPLECNGTRVTESVLRLGDIIRMGHYRFELLAAPDPGPSGRPDSADLSRPASGHRSSQASDSRETYLRDRLTELSQQWHARHAECEVRESRCDIRESELHGRETELWSRAENLQHRESLLMAQEAAAREIQETYAATQEELKSLRLRDIETNQTLKEHKEQETELLRKSELLQERQAELERRQAEWNAREEQYAEHAAQAQQKLEQTQRQAQSANDAVGRMRDEFATLSEQLTELRERHSELQEREKHEQEEHERLRGQLEASRDEAIDALAQSETRRSDTENELQRVAADLQSTRQELAKVREESRLCQQELSEKLRSTGEELQATREQASKDRRASEEDQAYSEKQIAELEERLATLQEHQAESERSSQAEIAELRLQHESAEQARTEAERAAQELRDSILQLQESVAHAKQEASQLRSEFEGANASVRQLELLVDQTKNNQSAQQESWIHESDQLRQTIEQLSDQLSAANIELGQLRSANEALTQELAETESEEDDRLADQQAVVNSEQFRALEAELETARQEIERLQSTHAETVSRLETERDESESALRREIEQLRDEIASAQLATEARIREILETEQVSNDLAKDSELAAEHKTSTDQFVRSGENVWRLESEQAVEQSSHLSDSIVQLEEDFEENSSSMWGLHQSDDDSTGHQDAYDVDNAVPTDSGDPVENGATWHDESPEHAVVDAIDDIEHNVGQAISDLQDEEPSVWPDPISDIEPAEVESEQEDIAHAAHESFDDKAPLDWSAYMPGGEVQAPVDTEVDESQCDDGHWDANEGDDLELEAESTSEIEAVDESLASTDEAVGPSAGWDSIDREAESDPVEPAVESHAVETTQAWDGSSDFETIADQDASDPQHDSDPLEQAPGSLAAMLIRDLTEDNHGDTSAALDDQAAQHDGAVLDDEHGDTPETTFVMERELSFSDEATDEESEAWNFASPEPYDEQDTQITFDEDSDDDVSESDVSRTAITSLRDTVVASDEAPPDDDSIEAYMSRLLQRVQGEKTVTASGPITESKPKPTPKVEEVIEETDPKETSTTKAEKTAIRDTTPLVPRSQAPELSRNLSAMRELANQSARNAVARSIRLQARDTQMKAAFKGGLAVCFAVMGIGAFIFVTWSATIKIGMVGAFLVLAGVFGQEAFILSRDARRRLALAEHSSSDPSEDEDAQEEVSVQPLPVDDQNPVI